VLGKEQFPKSIDAVAQNLMLLIHAGGQRQAVVGQPLVDGLFRLSGLCGQDGDFLELENDVL